MEKFVVPADVPRRKEKNFLQNWRALTRGTGKIYLLAGDQKIEHLNDDFFGPGISPEDASPQHLFQIANLFPSLCLATHPGLLARHGKQFSKLNYIVKLNAKTNLVPKDIKDPQSLELWDFKEVLELARSGLKIRGVGYTIYLGSQYEEQMLVQAGRLVQKAHSHGMLVIIWAYARGKSVKNETSPHIIAGCAGVASALGADFVKLHYPDSPNPSKDLQEAVLASGKTGVITAGGSRQTPKNYLRDLAQQIHVAGCAGAATGRNLHQRPLTQAVRLARAGAKIIFENASFGQALKIYRQDTRNPEK